MNTTTQWRADVALAPQGHAAADRLLRGLRTIVGRLIDRWRRHRQAVQLHAALHALDARTLRDIGLDRSEIGSVVAELTGDAEPTRVRTLRTPPRPHY